MLATCPDQRRNDPSDLPGLRGEFEVHLTVGPGAARRAIADHHGGEDDWRVRGLADAAERYAAQRAAG
ncbi:hypothetical protein ADK60_05405 [Streptomyces sp. XY431]|uniref:hypothetical protein n=1 Tax=Streptomyces sp. XY431 TaxID=1415562 RepID=UPI0006AF363A|nr:hypothetical protein [Streptomyces sp. XY431]KOV36982.1 hypothetical protein ADK60_05405 [Streptomyces sp. XY431]